MEASSDGVCSTEDISDPFDFKENIDRICNGLEKPSFKDSFLDCPTHSEDLDKELSNLLEKVDNYILTRQLTPDYCSTSETGLEVREICNEALRLIIEPIAKSELFNTIGNLFSKVTPKENTISFSKPSGLGNIYDALAKYQKMESDAGFITVKKPNLKRKIKEKSTIPLKNSFAKLNNDLNIDNAKPTENMVANDNKTPDSQNVENKPKINPFFVEFTGNWTDLAQTITAFCEIKPQIKLDGERLKIHCKNEDDFRRTQRYLDQNKEKFKFTTLNSKDLRPLKFVIRGIPTYTDPKIVIDALKENNFTATRAAMLKSRKNGKPLPIYLVNIVKCDNIEKLYEIKLLLNIDVKIERYQNKNTIKQCYACQGFNHSSEICGFTPRCLKCAEPHLTKNCPKVGRITPTCCHCNGQHIASYRGCPKNPFNLRKNKITYTNKNTENTPIDNNSEFHSLLSTFNYTKKTTKDPPPNLTNNPNSSINNDLQEITKSFSEIKELLQFNKIISCFKNIAIRIKTSKDPMEKLLVLLEEFEKVASTLN